MGPDERTRGPLVAGVLTVLSLLAGLATALLGVLLAPLALGAVGALVAYRLEMFGEDPPGFPRPRPSLAWLGELGRFLVDFVAWAAPQVPFLAPFVVFVAVTWPLPQESVGLQFQEQASQIIVVLLIAYGIEAGAIRWRRRPVNWILSAMTVAILIVGEVYALVDLATGEPGHADVIAGAMAAGLTAILVAAIQGSLQREGGPAPDRDEPAG
ncbi:MAG TPA: hypothetical protein VFY48_01645 [Solirubrobacterales bacterium]|nr:hypothetical protein [Solirubrobacterales bacterium]